MSRYNTLDEDSHLCATLFSKIKFRKRPISVINAFFRSQLQASENFIEMKKGGDTIYLLNEIPYSIMIQCTNYMKKRQERKCRSSH